MNNVQGEFVLDAAADEHGSIRQQDGAREAPALAVRERRRTSPSSSPTTATLASITSYELLFDESDPPSTMMRTWGAVSLSSMTDIPFVRSGIDGVTGAMSVQTPVLAPVRVK